MISDAFLSIPFFSILSLLPAPLHHAQQLETYKDGEGPEPSSQSQLLPDGSHDKPNQKKENVGNGCDFRKSWEGEREQRHVWTTFWSAEVRC